jgi:uncharacterized protein YukJ
VRLCPSAGGDAVGSRATRYATVLKGRVVDCRVKTNDTPHYQVHLRADGTDHRAAINVRSAQQSADLLFLLDDDVT